MRLLLEGRRGRHLLPRAVRGGRRLRSLGRQARRPAPGDARKVRPVVAGGRIRDFLAALFVINT